MVEHEGDLIRAKMRFCKECGKIFYTYSHSSRARLCHECLEKPELSNVLPPDKVEVYLKDCKRRCLEREQVVR